MTIEIHNPELEEQLTLLAAQAGRPAGEIAEDAIAGYLAELADTRSMLDSRYDDLKSGKVEGIDGEEFFESLRQREEDLLKNRKL